MKDFICFLFHWWWWEYTNVTLVGQRSTFADGHCKKCDRRWMSGYAL